MTVSISVIIPTIGRETLTRSVTSVLQQRTGHSLEVVVANDSGKPLPFGAWQNDPRVKFIETNRVERSHARNRGAQIAQGAYFLFLDDDDWLLPDGLEHLAVAIPSHEWILGDCQLVTRKARVLETVEFEGEGNCAVQAIAGEWLVFQSMLIHRDLFFQLGGFRPIAAAEDREFASRLALHSDLHRVRIPVACVSRDGVPSTSVYSPETAQLYWQMRDALLDAPQTFRRLRDSAREPYWRGKLVRLYLNATLVNVQRGNVGKSVARMGRAIQAGLTPEALWNAPAFWRGVLRGHATHTR